MRGSPSRADYSTVRVLLFGLVVTALAPATDMEILTMALPWAIAGRNYAPPPLETRTSGRCPLGTVGYSVVAGVLPPGVQMSAAGYFSGVPLQTGRYSLIIRAANVCIWTARRFDLVVTGAPLLLVEPARIEIRVTAGERAPPESVRVSGTWPGAAYRVLADAPWIGATPELGRIPFAGGGLAADVVQVSVSGKDLPPGRYEGALRFTMAEAANAPLVTVVLVVEPARIRTEPTRPAIPPPE